MFHVRRLLVGGLCAVAVAAFAQDAAPAEIAEKVDGLYARRDEAAAYAEMEKLLADGLKATPNDYGLLWRMSRHRYWQADVAAGEKKKTLGKEAWDFGERAVRADPSKPEGHYFAGIGLGAYSQGAGILKALSEGLEGKFNERIDKSMQLAPGLERGGPVLTKGRYHYELPWPKRSLEKSARLLEQVIKKHPENLRAYLYLAETQLLDGEAKKAKETLKSVLEGAVAYDPPEGRRVQSFAKKVQAEIEEELK